MKNLFNYATKELSQDAFLMWLFENYDDSELGEIANALLGNFCNFQKDEKVHSLETVAQWCKIDITVWMTTTFNRKIVLCIEDKTFSNEHNQLSTYNAHIDGVSNHTKYKIFYKTSRLEDDEKERVKASGWRIVDIDEINAFWEKYQSCTNLIVSQYAQYVNKIAIAINNKSKPQESKTIADFLSWKSYFENIVIPVLKKDFGSSCHFGSWKAGQYPYVVLYIKKEGFGTRNIPYLEIRSRDCCNNKALARILCYGVSDEDLAKNQQKLIDNIKAIPEYECKGLVTSHKGKNIHPKQVGYSKTFENIETNEQFIGFTKKYIDLYLQAMQEWS